MLYILNSLIVPVNFQKYPQAFVKLKAVALEEAKNLLKIEPFISAIGHTATAEVLSSLLETHIPVNRTQVFLEPGDKALHFVLLTRLPEGKVLTKEELLKLPFQFVLSEFLF